MINDTIDLIFIHENQITFQIKLIALIHPIIHHLHNVNPVEYIYVNSLFLDMEDFFPNQSYSKRGSAIYIINLKQISITCVMVDIICRPRNLDGGANGSRHDTESPAPKPATKAHPTTR